MSRDVQRSAPPPVTEHGWSFEETERRQLLAGLALTPLERLRWLERRKQELQGLLGRAAGEAAPTVRRLRGREGNEV